MLTKRIIPCLDVKDGRVVKGTRFLSLRDAGDPVLVAGEYDRQGADELVFLDITASHERRKIILDVVQKTAESVFMPLTVGGGGAAIDDIRALLNAGADKVSINTAAVKNPEFVKEAAKKFGSQCIVVAIDAKCISPSPYPLPLGERDSCLDPPPSMGGEIIIESPSLEGRGQGRVNRWQVFTHGGRNTTGIDVITWAKKMEGYGAGEILLTSMDRDGTKDGYDLELTAAVSSAVSIPVIASGGVGAPEHIYDGLTKGKADAALAASIFHFGEYSVGQVKKFLVDRKVPVRLT